MGTPKDLLGQTITKGCLIAYANIIGRSANQCIYEVTDIVEHTVVRNEVYWDLTTPRVAYTTYKLKAKPLDRSYSNASKPVTLAMLERAVVLPDSYREHLEE